ncbi:Zinc metalloprotease [uncultured Synechococcales cyanobacterium]|uniref:Zinc metalloprotease n=1 Tax=uncultured Synechococcales cyanobacterium TaxID=1936017 RepID=A0A6J4VRL8_9CYAN|nr:Zinc metalloprotease [uncultured Synechococcales cyanobacterium]
MDIITALLVSTAVGVLAWGFYRARLLGRLGILAWLQSVVLFAPWLLTFSLVAAGITINAVSTLFLLLISIVIYVILGNRLRIAASQEAALSQPSKAMDEPAYQDDTESASSEPSGEEPAQLTQKAQLLSMPEADLKLIRGVFGFDTFFVTETIPYQEGAIFKGNLRGEPEAVYAQLSHSLQAQLAEQYRLFLVEDQDGKPVVIVLPSRNDPQQTTLTQKVSAGLFLLLTLFTSLEASALLQHFDVLEAPSRWLEALPISVGLLSTLAIHELGHWLLARRHQVRLSPPFLIPAWQIGSFGAITQFKSLLPNRKVLFDVALAGPAAGGILSLGLLLIGLLLSQPNSLFQIPTPFFQGSILVGTLARVVLGSALQQPLVSVHPLVVVGWLGLVITALNLMPAGRLDGGRIMQAIYGRKVAGRATAATLILLAIASLANPLALYWAVVILFLQREPERPSLNELSEPDDARAALGLLALFLMVATLLPLTPAIAGRLGIGG